MTESLRLGRLYGVPVGINWSVLVIFALITTGLAAGRFPHAYPDLPAAAYVAAGLSAGIVFFLSLLAHEMAHAITARRNGVGIDGITLWLFGGVARLKGDAPNWGADLRIAGIGPLVSLVLSAFFLSVAASTNAAGAHELLTGVFVWLGVINLVLAVFNLVPAAPLDGGRILRALLWRRTGNRTRAAVAAARAGRGFGWLLIIVGLFQFVGWGFLAGLWWVLIGWFVINAARAEEQHVQTMSALHGVRVADVMTRDPVTAPEDITVQQLIDDYVFGHRFSTFPLVGWGEQPTGLVTLRRVKEVPGDERTMTRVRDIACPLADVAVVEPGEPLADLVPKVTQCADERALVVHDSMLVGIVSPTDITRRLETADLRASPELAHA